MLTKMVATLRLSEAFDDEGQVAGQVAGWVVGSGHGLLPPFSSLCMVAIVVCVIS